MADDMTDMCNEPVMAPVADTVVCEEPSIPYEVDFGYPRTLDELKSELHEAQAERNDPSKWMTSQEYSEAERWEYEASQKVYWDNYSVVKTAERKGEIKGLQQGLQQGVQQEKIDTIHRLQAMGLSVEQIAQGAGMNVDEVKQLLQ